MSDDLGPFERAVKVGLQVTRNAGGVPVTYSRTRNIGGTDYVFTVEAMTIGEVAWDWSDVAKSQYDITTRKDGSAAYEVSEPTGFDISGNELRYD